MSILLPAIYLLIFIFLIFNLRFFNIVGTQRKTLALLFIVKVLCGVILSLIYEYYYKSSTYSDAYAFYNDGVKIFKSIYTNPLDYLKLVTGIGSDAEYLQKYLATSEYWNKLFNYNLYNDNRILIRFNAVICLFSFGYYQVHTVFMVFLSFVGLTAIFKAFLPFLNNKKTELLICVFLIPSVLLWTSGILKESIVTFAFGIFIYSFFKLFYQKIKPVNIFGLLLGIFLLLVSKFYFLIAALPGLAAFLWTKSRKKNTAVKFLFVHVLFFLILYLCKYIASDFYFLDIVAQKQHDFINMAHSSGNTGSLIKIPELHATMLSLMKNSFSAFVNTLFRPHIFEIKSIIMIPSAIENMIILFSIVFFIVYSGWKSMADKAIFFSLLSFVVILFILFGLITPVLGSLVRYRAPVLPFVFIVFLMLYNKDKFKKSTVYKYFSKNQLL